MKRLLLITTVFLFVNNIVYATPLIHVEGQRYGNLKTFPDSTVSFAGELRLTAIDIDSVSSGEFISICIERDEDIITGSYYDAILNTEAILGGKGGASPDPLNNETAWLYSYYLDNVCPTLLPENWLQNNKIAEDYAMAIWALEEEIHPGYLSPNAKSLYDNAKLNYFDWNNDSIRVLNLYAFGTYGTDEVLYRQDVLVRIPLPSTITLICAGLGFIRLNNKRSTKSR